jgi:hypothetical protein
MSRTNPQATAAPASTPEQDGQQSEQNAAGERGGDRHAGVKPQVGI